MGISAKKGVVLIANGHGGARPGAGRKKKSLADKLLEGNPGHQKLMVLDLAGNPLPTEPPEYTPYYGSKKAGSPDAEDIYRETVAWLQQTGCGHLVQPSMVFDYAITKAHWYECERYITTNGLGYVPEKKKVVENPIIDTSLKYFKMADMAWGRIWDIVAQNSQRHFGNPHKDPMAGLLEYDPRKGD